MVSSQAVRQLSLSLASFTVHVVGRRATPVGGPFFEMDYAFVVLVFVVLAW